MEAERREILREIQNNSAYTTEDIIRKSMFPASHLMLFGLVFARKNKYVFMRKNANNKRMFNVIENCVFTVASITGVIGWLNYIDEFNTERYYRCF